jgi:hypothetical protein
VSAHIYWYAPGDRSPLRDLDLGRALSELIEYEVRRSTVLESLSGRRTQQNHVGMMQVRVNAEYLNALRSPSVIRELQAIIGHLKRNGTIALAEDDECAWGGFLQTLPRRGELTLRLRENLWDDWGTPSLTAGGSVIVQGPGPEMLREEVVITARTGKTITLDTGGLLHDYSEQAWVFVRDARFWPYLRLSAAQLNSDILQTQHRITYTLDGTFEEPPNKLEKAYADGTAYRSSTATAGGAQYDVDATDTATATIRGI